MGNFFTDVICKSTEFKSTKRVNKIDLLEPNTREKVLAIISDAKLHGVDLMVYETYRSPERQLELFNRGATKLKNVGVHYYGLACDIVKEIDGEPSWKGDFSILCELAHQHGLISGQDWGNPNIKHSFIDTVHVQRITVAEQAKLFQGTWYPDNYYKPFSVSTIR